ncbi:MAG: putative lipid II flippase FtsW [Bacilli bacterium]|nr:putative lipid II flippase FtsW [Bacilli bacterium]
MKKEIVIVKLLSTILILFGLLIIYSSSYVWSNYKFNNGYHYVLYQFIFLLISLFISKVVIKIDLNIIKKNINKLLLIGIILLLLVIIPGVGVVRNGSRSWFSIGPLSMQPSEFIKIILIIFTAKYLEKYHYKINKLKDNLFPLIIILGAVILLIMLEPDFGSSMIIILTILSMVFISGLKYRFFSYIGLLGILGITFIIIIAPYRMARIISFINPWKDPLGSGYQIIQSLYAVAPGGLFGHGIFSSIQKYFYLPEPQTDFIFAIFCEEFGFIISVLVILMFIILFYNIYKISAKQSDLFKKFLSFGILSSLVVQTVMNLCVVVGLVPVTGVTLPFFSYGGSSLLISILEISLIINISKS